MHSTSNHDEPAIITSINQIIRNYPVSIVLIIWLLGILSVLLVITACIAYMYIALLSLFCGVRIVPGVDPGSYISASPSKFLTGLLSSCCGNNVSRWFIGEGNSGYMFTPKKKAVYTV